MPKNQYDGNVAGTLVTADGSYFTEFSLTGCFRVNKRFNSGENSFRTLLAMSTPT